jgi:metal-sulfur cluster biosynthetic enzyme
MSLAEAPAGRTTRRAGAERAGRPPAGGPGQVTVDPERVRKVAGAVRDPEVRTPIADLGLLDEVEVDGGQVTVRFHLTSPLCPAKFAGSIGQDIRRRVGKLPGVESVEVVLQDHFMAEALHRLINEGDRSAETHGLLR